MIVHGSEMRAALERMRAEFGVTGRDVLRDMTALNAKAFMAYTPPFKSAAATEAGYEGSARKLGEDAVTRDIERLFVPLTEAEHQFWQIEGGQDTAVKIRDSGVVYGVEMHLFRPYADEAVMRAHHMRYRSRTTGRVSRAGVGQIDGKQIGRWKFVDRMHVRRAALEQYVAKERSHVGTAKAGWLPAIDKFTQNAITARPPRNIGWVRRNAVRARGTAAAYEALDRQTFRTLIENGVAYVATGRMMQRARAVMRTRQRDLMTGRYFMRMAKVCSKHSAKAAA